MVYKEQPDLRAGAIGSVVLGALSGVALGLWAPAYWALQVVAVVGGVLAGLEHVGAKAGALRGLAGGVLFGAVLLIVHKLSGLEPHASLGAHPILLPVVTGLIGAGLGALGGLYRGRSRRT